MGRFENHCKCAAIIACIAVMALGLVQESLAQKKDPSVTVNKRNDIVLTFEGDTEQDSLLLRAAYLGDATQIAGLLKAGANVEAKEHLYHIQPGDTPLCFAARENHLEAVRILLAHGAAVKGCFALSNSLKNPEMLRLILAHGADANERNPKPSPSDALRSPLLYAAASWHDDPADYTETIRLLLKAGADPKAISMYGQNALSLLGTQSPFTYGPPDSRLPQIEDIRYFDVVGLLVKNGVEINRTLSFYYDKLCCADVEVRKGSPYCYQVTDKGCMVQEERELCNADRVELESTPGATPLAIAAYISNVGLVRALLHFGADPTVLYSNRNLVIKDHEIQQLLAGKLPPTPRPKSDSAQASERPSTSPQPSVPALHKTAIDDQFTKYICYTGPGHRPGYKENAETGFGADKYLDVRIDDPSGSLSGEAITEIGRELSRGLVVWRRMCLQCATANSALLSINGRFFMDRTLFNLMTTIDYDNIQDHVIPAITGACRDVVPVFAVTNPGQFSPPTPPVDSQHPKITHPPQFPPPTHGFPLDLLIGELSARVYTLTPIVPYVEVSSDDSSIQRLCSVELSKVPNVLRGVRSALDCAQDKTKGVRNILHIRIVPSLTLCPPDDNIIGCEPNEFSIELNAGNYQFVNPENGKAVFGRGEIPVDLQIVLLHELGHWAGIQQHLKTTGNIMASYITESHCIDSAVITALAQVTKSPTPFTSPQTLLYKRPGQAQKKTRNPTIPRQNN